MSTQLRLVHPLGVKSKTLYPPKEDGKIDAKAHVKQTRTAKANRFSAEQATEQ